VKKGNFSKTGERPRAGKAGKIQQCEKTWKRLRLNSGA